MTTKTLYPNTVSQSSQNNTSYREFSNLSNIKNGSTSYARSENTNGGIASKVGTHKRPSKITATNFKAQIPTGSKINSVTVEYSVRHEGGLSIGKTTVDLTGVSIGAKNGKALTTTNTKTSLKFTGSDLTVSKVNSTGFGVTIDFPSNTSTNTGYVRIQYVRIIIDYTQPNFQLTSTHTSGTYTGEEHTIKLNISNTGKTGTNSNVSITVPSGCSIVGVDSGNGTLSGSTWNPKLSGTNSASIVLRVSISTNGSHSFKFSESATGHSNTLTFSTSAMPVTPSEEEDDSTIVDIETDSQTSQIKQIIAKQNEEILITSLPSGYGTMEYTNKDVASVSIKDYNFTNNVWVSYDWTDDSESIIWSESTVKIKVGTVCNFTLTIQGYVDGSWGTLVEYRVHIYPENLTTPSLNILKPSQEELDRLGDGYVYTVESVLKEVTSETYVRDWLKNFRIGVFNNAIKENVQNYTIIDENGETQEITYDSTDYDNLSISDIFANAEYWSEPPTTVNAYSDLTVQFPYQSPYPLYILITGDYTEADTMASIKYTEPCIIESEVYEGYEQNGNYPKPIRAVIGSETLSELVIPSFQSSSPFIAYDCEVENITSENIFIKGISIDLDIDYTDYMSLNLKLKSPTGKTGERSLVLEPSTIGTITIGDSNDRWGLTPNDLTNLEDWEIQLQADNLFNSDNGASTLILNNLIVNYYVAELEEQNVTVSINNENIAIYDTLIQEVDIPSGLETDTNLINIDGTDLNDAYLQNIREKTITIKFSILGCNLEETTRTLQELTALFTNERDNLNKPIPKRLDISIYPGIHWDYVMTEPLDTNISISDYEVTAKLLIPSGTAYTNEPIITNTVGKVNGIAKVNPTITLIPLNNHIEIAEVNSNQKWTMTYTSWTNTDTVTIDCENRTVTLNDTTDITAYSDYSNDWFKILGEFEFQPTNCLIQTISRLERK